MLETRYFIRIFDNSAGGLTWVATIAAPDQGACLSAAATAGAQHAAVGAYSATGDSIRRLATFGKVGFLIQEDEFM